MQWCGARGSCCLLVPPVQSPMAARADFWVRGHLGGQSSQGNLKQLCLWGDKPRCREHWERAAGNQQIPASGEPFVTSVSPLARGRGGAGELRPSLPGHWRAWAAPAVQTMLGTALSVVGGNGSWNFLSQPQGRANWIQESHTVSCGEWSLWCLCWFSPCPDTPVHSPSAPSLCQQPGRN